MQTPHEAAVEHLKTLNRSDHPELEEVLAVVRQYPVDIQRACEAEMKRSGQVAAIDPIKAVADRQAVEIQELLEAFTAPAAASAEPPSTATGFKQIPEFDAPMLSSVLFPSEPAVIASEPFNIAEPPESFAPGTIGATLKAEIDTSAADRALDDLAHEPLAEQDPVNLQETEDAFRARVAAQKAPVALDENHPAL